MKISAIITGSTGMVGEGVLHECLLHPDVERVLVINRKSCGVVHPKLKEVLPTNFYDLSLAEGLLQPYNACFFCLGVSSVGMNEFDYKRITYDLTLYMAETLLRLNPGMTFCYISGWGTYTKGRGKAMWARVKGKTEQALLGLPFKKAYMFRPGYIQPTRGLKNSLSLYVAFAWLYPVWRFLFPQFVCSLKDVGVAMINSVNKGYEKPILEVPDIFELARR